MISFALGLFAGWLCIQIPWVRRLRYRLTLAVSKRLDTDMSISDRYFREEDKR